MPQLIIKTGAPFGYLIILVIIVIALALASWWLIRSFTAKPIKKLQFASSFLVVGFLCLVAWSNIQKDDVEWNPLIRGNEPLVGRWEDEKTYLSLQSDGDYSCIGINCKDLGLSGKWQRFQDFEIDLLPSGGNPVRWRITENKGAYQFVSGAKGDPDVWQTKIVFTKQNAL